MAHRVLLHPPYLPASAWRQPHLKGCAHGQDVLLSFVITDMTENTTTPTTPATNRKPRNRLLRLGLSGFLLSLFTLCQKLPSSSSWCATILGDRGRLLLLRVSG